MAIASFDALKAAISVSGVAHKSNSPNDDILGTLNISDSTSFTYGASGADTVNQAISVIFSATNNTTTQLDLSGVLANLVGDSASTLTKIKWMLVEMLSTAQDSTNGTAATSVTFSPGSSNPITTSPLGSGASNPYTLENGDKWLIEKHNSGGITVTGGSADNFAVLNNDSAVTAKLRITILGNS